MILFNTYCDSSTFSMFRRFDCMLQTLHSIRWSLGNGVEVWLHKDIPLLSHCSRVCLHSCGPAHLSQYWLPLRSPSGKASRSHNEHVRESGINLPSTHRMLAMCIYYIITRQMHCIVGASLSELNELWHEYISHVCTCSCVFMWKIWEGDGRWVC